MTLSKYNKKRNFKNTPEPKGKPNKSKSKKSIFVIQFHQASHDHYDFRLEYNGVLLSWAVPKGLSTKTADKRLAVHVEDHPLSYANFEGEIPANQYGTGLVQIFDSGTYEPLNDFKSGFKKGKLTFILHGSKYKGEWHLIKMDDKNWIILKSKNDKAKSVELSKKIKANPFKKVDAMLALLTDKIPTGKDWLFEIKYDGYRIISFVENKKVKLKTRNNTDYTSKFNSISKSLAKLCKNHSVILDGELVAFDESGRSDFSLLQSEIKNNESNLTYVVFDILALDGQDLRDTPLIKRKEILQNFMKICPKNIIFSSFVISKGKQSFNLAKKNNLEGIIAKRLNSIYSGTRNGDWLKIKCYQRQEFVIAGYTTTAKNKKLSAILLGYYSNNNLIYIGKAGTGFTDKDRAELNKKFESLIVKKCPFSQIPKLNNNITWLKPKLVCEVQFAEITPDNSLRQPSFIALRTDKKPSQVVLEVKN